MITLTVTYLNFRAKNSKVLLIFVTKIQNSLAMLENDTF